MQVCGEAVEARRRHARALSFKHPATGKQLVIEAKVPTCFSKLVGRIPRASGGIEKNQEVTIGRAMKKRGMAWTATGRG